MAGMKSPHIRLGADSLLVDAVTHSTIKYATLAISPILRKQVELCEHSIEGRSEIEGFISRCFATKHGARIRHFMPRLLGLRTKIGYLIAAVGLRTASNSRLFLETYLDQPIEDVLKSKLGETVRREEIIEVGNLSSLYPGASRWLILALTFILHDEEYKWVTFTGTSVLRNSFSRLGLRPIELAVATKKHLSLSDRDNWGGYYENSPMVMAGDITYGHHRLSKLRNFSRQMHFDMNRDEAA